MQAVLKRTWGITDPDAGLLYAGSSVSYHHTRILEINKIAYQLNLKESELLQLLIIKKNNVLIREEALQKLWGIDDNLTRRNMDVIVSRLRKHLNPDKCVRIANVHNKGYILQEFTVTQ